MSTIKLFKVNPGTGKAVRFTFDLEDYLKIQSSNLRILESRKGYYQLFSSEYNNFVNRGIMNCPQHLEVDHISRDHCDNRKVNLRICTRSQNQMNTGKHKNCIYSKYKGVTYEAPRNRMLTKPWKVRITAQGMQRITKHFKTENEAALQYNEWAIKYHKEFAVTNTINPFLKDLAFGNQAEEYLYLHNKEKLEKLDGRGSDFKFIKSGKGLELKTDRYDPAKTANFFLELYSNKNIESLGGPFKAEKDGSEYFAYMFWQTKEVFCYETKKLIEFLNAANYPIRNVMVAKSRAAGFIVPRADLEHLRIDFSTLE